MGKLWRTKVVRNTSKSLGAAVRAASGWDRDGDSWADNFIVYRSLPRAKRTYFRLKDRQVLHMCWDKKYYSRYWDNVFDRRWANGD